MSVTEENRRSSAQRLAIAVAVVVALLGGVACVAPAGFWRMPSDEPAAERGRPAIQYTRLEFARAIERAIRGW